MKAAVKLWAMINPQITKKIKNPNSIKTQILIPDTFNVFIHSIKDTLIA